jgi:hypothetical protein
MHFVTTQKQEDISNWFRTICKVTVGDITETFPGILALDHHAHVSEVLATLEELEIQSVAIFSPRDSSGTKGVVDAADDGNQVIGEWPQLFWFTFHSPHSFFQKDIIVNYFVFMFIRNYIHCGCVGLFFET